MPVWLENDAPSTSSRSASFMTQLATGVPLRPSTPAASGWSSADLALGLEGGDHRRVELLGERGRPRGMWKRAPWPTMITGRFAARSSSQRVGDRRPPGGAIVDAATPALAGRARLAPSGAGSVWTSSGKTRCATSRRSIACFTRGPSSSSGSASGSTVWPQAATEPNAAAQVDLLERARAEHLGVDLAGQREHRRAVDLRVPQPGEQVGGARAGDRQARGGPAGELAVGGGGEGRGALVADADVGQLAGLLLAPQRVGEPEVGVADHAEDVLDAPVDHRLGHQVGDGARRAASSGDADADASPSRTSSG